MSGNVERSKTFAACSTVAGVLIASADVVSSAARFFAPHAKTQPSAHARKTFSITVREQRYAILSIVPDDIEALSSVRARFLQDYFIPFPSYFLLLTLLTGAISCCSGGGACPELIDWVSRNLCGRTACPPCAGHWRVG